METVKQVDGEPGLNSREKSWYTSQPISGLMTRIYLPGYKAD